ncbi:MAG: phosphate acyltransferase [Patescibacteria group bacterium]
MSQESVPTILLPEVDDPAIAALREADQNEHIGEKMGVNLYFPEEPMSLGDAAIELNKDNGVNIVIAGASHGSPDVLRMAIRDVGAPNKFISSFFIMEKEGEEPMFFADCAVHDKPKPHELVKIAEQTSRSVQQLGYEPVVAFLSLSTFGSADHLPGVQQIQQAAAEFKEQHPEIISYGELQVDAAIDPSIFKKKSKGGAELIDGKLPNVFIFPDGQSGNISYKFLEQKAGYAAIGPILDGVARDVHDLSRGVTLESLIRSCEVAGQLFIARQKAQAEKPKVATEAAAETV